MNGSSTCLTKTLVWLKHWVSKIIHCGVRESRSTKHGRRRATKAPSPPRKHGHGKEPVLTSGPLLLQEDLPSVANLFLLISPSAQIQRKRVLHGEISMSSIPASNSSSRIPRFHVQLRSQSPCLQRSKRCISIGLLDHSTLIVELTKIHASIVPTVT